MSDIDWIGFSLDVRSHRLLTGNRSPDSPPRGWVVGVGNPIIVSSWRKRWLEKEL
jgi:hypothetical protein